MNSDNGGQTRRRSCQASKRFLAPVILISVAMAGCAHWPSNSNARVNDNDGSERADSGKSVVSNFDQAALDSLADALAQIRTPQLTTLQTRTTANAHYRYLVSGLSALGYGIQRVNADQGAYFLDLAKTQENGNGNAGLVTYTLSVGAIELRRDFVVVSDDRYRPESVLKVSGTRTRVSIDDSRFNLSDELARRVSRVEYTAMTDAMVAMPVISLITDDVVAGVARSAVGHSSGITSLQALNSSKVEVSNRFFGSAGAFGDLRGGMNKVARQVVIFPNDSLRLGSDGKAQIASFLDQYQQGRDMIGLIGCSNGRTKLAIGNEGLALGRSERVMQELLSLGVARDVILDEGCWAPRSAGTRFPSRGVVIELLRREA